MTMQKGTVLCVVVVLTFVCCAVGAFTHPGVLIGKSQLDYIKQQVNAKVDPMYTAFTKAVKSEIGAQSYKAKGPPSSKVIECGSYSNPDYGCTDDDKDGSAAYLQSVLWYITEDKTYLDNAIKLLNAYSSLQKFTNSNAPLQAGWSASKWTRAADIVAHTSTEWSAADFAAFKSMLTKVHLPLIENGSASNGNWELSMIEGLIGIAVVVENEDLFQRALTFWKQRVPAYFYVSALDGNAPKPAPRGTANWYGQTIYNKSVDGLCQETCRDLGHTQFGLSAALNAAATAATQGQDLFGAESQRLTLGMEFNVKFLNGETPPHYVCNGQGVDAGTKYPDFELGYNHYHNKAGVSMPNTLEYINNHVRKDSNPTENHMIVYETLTSSGLPTSL